MCPVLDKKQTSKCHGAFDEREADFSGTWTPMQRYIQRHSQGVGGKGEGGVKGYILHSSEVADKHNIPSVSWQREQRDFSLFPKRLSGYTPVHDHAPLSIPSSEHNELHPQWHT